MNKHSLLITSAFFLTTPLAEAALLVGWDVDGVKTSSLTTPDYALANTVKDPNVEVSHLTLSSEVIADNPTNPQSRYGFRIGEGTDSLAAAITANHFIEFDITASSGYVLNLDSLNMNGQSSETGADNVAIYYSLDGFSTAGSPITPTTGSTASGFSGKAGGFDTDSDGFGGPIVLTGGAFQNINTANFRIYAWGSTNQRGITSIRNLSSNGGNDLRINGTVSAIPEISTTLPLGGLLGLTIIGFRRRKS
ncbi:MAG: hypothetical protein ACI8UZ_000859 [Akkermansiaceae bacterium]|jgi:hypothetical protein